MTGQLWVPTVKGSAFSERKSTSALLSQVKLQASRRSTRVSGWSALLDDDLGYVDLEEKTLQPPRQPSLPKGVNDVFGTFCKGLSGPHID
jgi:hypothetical protein